MSDVEVVNLFGETMVAPWHGTSSGYRRGCRCEPCKIANKAERQRNAAKRKSLITGDEDWHGTAKGYGSQGCRCEKCKLAQRASTYKMSPDRLKKLLESARCNICNTRNPGKKGWVIDHDHSCCPGTASCGNCVREVLCHGCNLMLGLAKDNPEIMRSAIAYLELHAA